MKLWGEVNTNFHLSESKQDRVLVVTIHTNDVQMLEMQHHLLSKHLKMPYDFVVGFDKPESEIFALGQNDTESRFRDFTNANGLSLVHIPREAHYARDEIFHKSDFMGKPRPLNPAFRCADSVQYMLSVVPWQKYRALLLIDADMFPIRDIEAIPVSFATPFYGVHQVRTHKKESVEYLWNGIFWISGDAPFQHLINFDFYNRRKLGTDVGGQTYKWIQQLAKLGRPGKFLNHHASGHWDRNLASQARVPEPLISWLENDYRNVDSGKYFAELYDETFFHYRAGSNWQNRDPGIDLKNRATLMEAVF